MNKKVMTLVKLAVTAGALAAALTGCCMFGSNDCCGANAGSHGVSAHADTAVGANGVTAGAGGGVH